jgi:hypothetical protein
MSRITPGIIAERTAGELSRQLLAAGIVVVVEAPGAQEVKMIYGDVVNADFELPAEDFADKFIKPAIAKIVGSIVKYAPSKRITTFPLPTPFGTEFCARKFSNGINIRCLRAYDILRGEPTLRFDLSFAEQL